jgi:hypothetical protein
VIQSDGVLHGRFKGADTTASVRSLDAGGTRSSLLTLRPGRQSPLRIGRSASSLALRLVCVEWPHECSTARTLARFISLCPSSCSLPAAALLCSAPFPTDSSRVSPNNNTRGSTCIDTCVSQRDETVCGRRLAADARPLAVTAARPSLPHCASVAHFPCVVPLHTRTPIAND